MPRPLRLLPAVPGLILAGHALGVIDPLKAIVYLLAPAGLAASAYAGLWLRRNLKAWRGGAGSGWDSQSGWRAFEVEVIGSKEDVDRFLAALNERAASGSRYILLSLLDSGVRSYLVIVGSPWQSADVEAEIVKSIATAVGGVRLSAINLDPSTPISMLTVLSGLGGKGRPLAVIPSLESRARSVSAMPVVVVGERIDSPTATPVTLTADDVVGHVAIFGSTGTGKSTTASLLACQLSERFSDVVILDWTGEYTEKLSCSYNVVRPVSDPAPIDPLRVPEVDEELAIEVIARALSLTPPQEYLLSTIIDSYKPGSLKEIYSMLERLPDDARWDKEVRRALQRKIGVLLRGTHAKAFTGASERVRLARGLSVVRVDEIRLSLPRRAYILFMLAVEFAVRAKGGGRHTPRVYIIDEAHNVFNAPEADFAGYLLAEARKYGMHFVVVTQSPAMMPNTVLLNTNTKIIHALRSAKDKEVVASTLSLDSRVLRILDKLDRGEAVVQSPSQPEPILVRVKLG